MRISAVLVGLANAAVFALTADRLLDDAFSYFLGDLPSWRLSNLYALSAVAAGLLASEVVLMLVSGGFVATSTPDTSRSCWPSAWEGCC